MGEKTWEILGKGEDVIETLLSNRGIKKNQEKEFFHPKDPALITLKELGLTQTEMAKAVARIKRAQKNKEKVIVYGDYDADGICATAILWEALYSLGVDCLPFIPDRFNGGYGLNQETIADLKVKHPNLSLIVTVDNGIVAVTEIAAAKKLGIEVIVTDHHEKGKKIPKAILIHTTKICGAALAWVLARELRKAFQKKNLSKGLDLAGIGTIADQMPLVFINRSFAKHGLVELNKTDRVGLLALIKEAGLTLGQIDAYGVGFGIAPRLNAMGRLSEAMESLRLLCTKDELRAQDLADLLGKTNLERQKIVDEVVVHTRARAEEFTEKRIIILAHETYHEGVIGLAAAKLVEEYYRPAIVFSIKDQIAKASARSIPGFNIIETVRKTGDLMISGGGHEMAAGFVVAANRLEEFSRKIEEIAVKELTDDLLVRKMRVDLELPFVKINWDLAEKLSDFAPTGLGNPTPNFAAYGVEILSAKSVGREGKHLKLKLRQKEKVFDGIAFGWAALQKDLVVGKMIDLVYSVEVNVWNGSKSLELKIKDLKLV